ncbi:LEAF RUST 10 DISEASE-RESISTANCE LOCUS RECEPTOR-LIKE PROTEIN KINASE-like 1.2 isoform X2 [Musa acuminata AAA Group]|uniref:LEAF RUST 10 DISEASE-RESISTANCE LOCUS RECEPTOR-LIKE PROTEIN KINASE-like 1.2 isoform X2 n=1 Tax=Musa acuminata AAA Group TaxID=214697 RepID=UPI0031DB99C8
MSPPPLASSELCGKSQMHPGLGSPIPSILLLLALSSTPPSSSESYYRYADCAPHTYSCGGTKINISYPFRVDGRADYCGYPGYYVSCSKNNTSMTIEIDGKGYLVKNMDYMNRLITVVDPPFVNQSCPQPYQNTSLDFSLYSYSDRDVNVTVFVNCTTLSPPIPVVHDMGCAPGGAGGRHGYYQLTGENHIEILGNCSSLVVVPIHQAAAVEIGYGKRSFSDAVKGGFSLRWEAGEGWCRDCVESGGRCGFAGLSPESHTCFCPHNSTVGTCSPSNKAHVGHLKAKIKGIIIGVSAATGVFLLLCTCYRFYKHKKKRQFPPSSKSLSQSASLKPSLMDPEMDSALLQTHVFSYAELEEATNKFDASNTLGDGGFCTVYKGKIQDGRTVAVKRLYENNYRRVEQFMNEIQILSRLRHQRLVILYGCTSHQSRELLLVYEFVSNGTLAHHLHGSPASQCILTWPMRLRIAIETADALAYLHAVNPPVIHRDVKTNNILLDSNFHVKVADFGLSRLIPKDVTHISTAPQGTPGYLDPEYHQCFQLTDKSDVYSFGVVLFELITSKPAVDMTRNRSEINLANMAITRIQKGELEQLVDAALGYQSDEVTRKMITMVAEVAFRCLQSDGDMRPPIKEVLEVLQAIESDGNRPEKKEHGVAESRDDAELLKNTEPFSPDSVMNRWTSRSTTPQASE